jgi:hypothetical protein
MLFTYNQRTNTYLSTVVEERGRCLRNASGRTHHPCSPVFTLDMSKRKKTGRGKIALPV